MKILISLLCLTLGLSILSKPAKAQFVQENKNTVVRYQLDLRGYDYYSIMNIFNYLNNAGYDLSGINWENPSAELILSSSDLAYIVSTGLKGNILEYHEPASENAVRVDERYLDPTEVESILKKINEAAPEVTRLEVIGQSLAGEPIYGLLLSTTPNIQNPKYYSKPSMIVDGLHHAREIVTPEVSIEFAMKVLEAAYAQNERAIDILETWNIWIVPMLNVDGSRIVWSEDSYWRKNARGSGGNVFGVDINRNYGYRFNECNGSSGRKGSQTYRGEHAQSEPETIALINLADRILPAAYISYHSFSELILFPYGCNKSLTGEDGLHRSVSQEMSQHLPTDSGRGQYKPGAPWEILYGVDGDSMSHMHASYGAFAITLEIGTAFQPPYSKRDEIVNKNVNSLIWLTEKLSQSLFSLQVVSGNSFAAVQYGVEILPIRRDQGEAPLRTNSAGYFHKVLSPGDYVIRVTSPDGRVVERKLSMTNVPKSMTISL